jgi:uncharacterized membrane protein SpoIIM required for sporulation
MDLTTFLQQRRPEWRQLEQLLERAEGSGLASLDDEQAVEFGRLYRRAASDLNQAQTFISGDATVRYLNDLVACAYLAIYGRNKADPWGVVRYLIWGWPAVFRRNSRPFLLATFLFVAGGVFGFLACEFDKETARAFLLPSNMPTIQPPKEGEPEVDFSQQKSSGEVAEFGSFLMTHNISVTLTAFALGITLGVGTAWLMFYNGVMTGALGAVFYDAGALHSFATGILPHGVLEIPAMLIGGAAGFVLAQGLWHAKPWPRSEELGRRRKEALWLLAGIFPLLIAAGILEAGVARTADRLISPWAKLGVAAVVGLTFLIYTLLIGWKAPSVPETTP